MSFPPSPKKIYQFTIEVEATDSLVKWWTETTGAAPLDIESAIQLDLYKQITNVLRGLSSTDIEEANLYAQIPEIPNPH